MPYAISLRYQNKPTTTITLSYLQSSNLKATIIVVQYEYSAFCCDHYRADIIVMSKWGTKNTDSFSLGDMAYLQALTHAAFSIATVVAEVGG